MTSADLDVSLAKVIQPLDRVLGVFERWFHVIANLCLIVMLFGTAVTIVLRPINVSFYWIWPWTMVCFVWMSFFGFYVARWTSWCCASARGP
jgi:TRAP-type C4-dicarboxylate transport system permease small subunit